MRSRRSRSSEGAEVGTYRASLDLDSDIVRSRRRRHGFAISSLVWVGLGVRGD